MRARSMPRLYDPRRSRPTPCPYHGGPSAIDAVMRRIEQSGAYTWVVRQKSFADNLLTGRPVHMEICRTIALAEELPAALHHCAEILEGLGGSRSAIGSKVEVRGTMVALRWRRRFPGAVRQFRAQRAFGMGR